MYHRRGSFDCVKILFFVALWVRKGFEIVKFVGWSVLVLVYAVVHTSYLFAILYVLRVQVP